MTLAEIQKVKLIERKWNALKQNIIYFKQPNCAENFTKILSRIYRIP